MNRLAKLRGKFDGFEREWNFNGNVQMCVAIDYHRRICREEFVFYTVNY